MPERIPSLNSKEKFQASICRVDSEGFDARVYSEQIGAESEEILATKIRGRISMLIEHYSRLNGLNPTYPLLSESNFKILKPGETIPVRPSVVRYPTPGEMMLIEVEKISSTYPEQVVGVQELKTEKELVGVR